MRSARGGMKLVRNGEDLSSVGDWGVVYTTAISSLEYSTDSFRVDLFRFNFIYPQAMLCFADSV